MQTTKRNQSDTGKFQEFSRGWFIILGAAIGVGVGVSSLPYYTMGIFITELEGEFNWSRSQLSLGILFWTLSLALAGPFVGRLVDKYGVRVPAALSMMLLGAGFLVMGLYLQHYWQFILLLISLSILGAATTPVSFTRIVNSWFHKARGLSLGLTLMGTGVTATFVPSLLTKVIADHGWRGGYIFLSLIIFAAIPIILLLLKPNPNDEKPIKAKVTRVANSHSKNDGQKFYKSGVFILLTSIFFLLAVAISGLLVHFIPLMLDAGHTKMQAASIAGLIGLSVMAGRMVVGVLIDKYFAPYVGACTFALCGLGCLILLLGGANPLTASIAAIAIGFGMGAEVDLIGYLTVRYFGMKSYGLIYSYQYSAFLLGAGIGPFWIGYAYDITNGYTIPLIVSAVILLIASILFTRMPPYIFDK